MNGTTMLDTEDRKQTNLINEIIKFTFKRGTIPIKQTQETKTNALFITQANASVTPNSTSKVNASNTL